MGQAFDDQPRSWGPLFSGLPRREGPDHTALLDFLEQNRARALAATHFDTGMVCINGYNLAIPNMPFGGVKNSGYGREHGGFGMKEFVNAKSLYVTQ